MANVSLPVFVEAAARASVILASTGLAAAALRRSSASARHLVWVLGLVTALVVPALSIAMPKWELPIVRTAAAPVPAPVINQVVDADRDLPAKAGSYLPNKGNGGVNGADSRSAGRERSAAPGFSREAQQPRDTRLTFAEITRKLPTTTLL